MTALLFGLWNIPIPRPTTARRQMTSKASADSFKPLRRNRPKAAIIMPQKAKPLVPIRSEAAPLRGAANKIAMAPAAITSPTLSMLYCRTNVK